jgi:hypothetical protein
MLGDAEAFDFGVWEDTGEPATGIPQEDRQAITHGTRVSVTIAAKIAATTPSTARGTMPIWSSRSGRAAAPAGRGPLGRRRGP